MPLLLRIWHINLGVYETKGDIIEVLQFSDASDGRSRKLFLIKWPGKRRRLAFNKTKPNTTYQLDMLEHVGAIYFQYSKFKRERILQKLTQSDNTLTWSDMREKMAHINFHVNILKGKRNTYSLWIIFVSKMYCLCKWICVWNIKYSYLNTLWYISLQTDHVRVARERKERQR